MKRTPITRLLGAGAVLLTAAAVAAGCGSEAGTASGTGTSSDGSKQDVRLSLVAFSTPREAYEALIPEFQKTDEGEGVEFDQSYGSAGEQARAVASGLPTDITHLAGQFDIDKVADADLLVDDWNDNEYEGFLTNSTVALIVRKGNPKKITGWDDLTKDGIEVVTANPFTSGGARWNIMALYGAWTREGASHTEALDKIEAVLRNTPVQAKSAREALQVFQSGKGDVMISYEQEAILGETKGEDYEHFVPDSTILIQNPAGVLKGTNEAAATAFLEFLYTEPAQRQFAELGYRPALESAAEGIDFPKPKDLFTIEDLGGWDEVGDAFFDRQNGHIAKIALKLGVPTDG